jgi:thioredoxin reductase
MAMSSILRAGIIQSITARPSLTKLQEKQVAMVGTGATAVEIIPRLAKWAKHLYAVQHPPPAADDFAQHVSALR